jgi:hypothetical protein
MKKTIIFGSLLFFIVAIAIQKYGRNDTCHKHLPNNDKVISEKKQIIRIISPIQLLQIHDIKNVNTKKYLIPLRILTKVGSIQ